MKIKTRKLINEIMDLSVRVNNETDYCAFVTFSGHVDLVEVAVCESKTLYDSFVYRVESYLPPSDLYKGEKTLLEIIGKLKTYVEV